MMQSKIAVGMFAMMALMGNVYAADINSCPKVSDIKSTPYTDPSVPVPHNTGFKYTASSNGKTWSGETLSTRDDFLDPKYELKAENYSGDICSYGGKTIKENNETSIPYLKLKAS